MEIDNTSDENEATKNSEETNDKISEKVTSIPKLISPIQSPVTSPSKPSPENEFQNVKKSEHKNKNKKVKNEKCDFMMLVCDQNVESAKTQLKFGLNRIDKILNCSAFTVPELISKSEDKHLKFSTKVRRDKVDAVIQCIKNGELHSNVVMVIPGNDATKEIVPRYSEHEDLCNTQDICSDKEIAINLL